MMRDVAADKDRTVEGSALVSATVGAVATIELFAVLDRKNAELAGKRVKLEAEFMAGLAELRQLAVRLVGKGD